MKGLVLDSSALYYGKDLPDGYELIISPGVVRELEKEGMGPRLEFLLASKLRVYSPEEKHIEKAKLAARATGDISRLSNTDIEVLALALETGYQLVTDDYSIQNTAAELGVPCRGLDQRGITSVWHWEARCIGCGKTFESNVDVCDICGSGTKSSRKRKTRTKG